MCTQIKSFTCSEVTNSYFHVSLLISNGMHVQI